MGSHSLLSSQRFNADVADFYWFCLVRGVSSKSVEILHEPLDAAFVRATDQMINVLSWVDKLDRYIARRAIILAFVCEIVCAIGKMNDQFSGCRCIQ